MGYAHGPFGAKRGLRPLLIRNMPAAKVNATANTNHAFDLLDGLFNWGDNLL